MATHRARSPTSDRQVIQTLPAHTEACQKTRSSPAAPLDTGRGHFSREDGEADPQFAYTLERGLRILQSFSAAFPRLSNRELSELTGLPKPTVSRLTYTLIRIGYLRRCEGDSHFEVSPAVLRLGYSVVSHLAFRRVAMPHLHSLANAINGSAVILTRDGLSMLTLESAAKRDVFHRWPAPGNTVNLIGTAVGLGWLVGATRAERDRLLREIAQHDPAQADRVRADYAMALQQLAKFGFVFRRNVIRPDTCTMVTPLRRLPGEDVLVLACAVATTPARAAAIESAAAKLLLVTATQITDDRFGV